MDPVLELQGVIIQRLRSFAAVTALVGQKSYDQPPLDQNGNVQATTYPYISIGPSNFQSEDADCIDGGEVMIQIDAWSIEPGHPQVRNIADAIRKAFRGSDITLAQNALATFEHWRTDYIANGTLKQASVRFTAIIEQP
ncbi:DUF3168 domain-containing protein [Mesorhizobium sp. DCY119]|uniref:DUF3168 domain-containing protein n=1 Tax=Mesorhizobium sp. DCY119 TaxID=2108445 RepID=UPI000E6B5F6B|nr:DUF3168 domain-containing protein [Mesorhizobium sp. DCY119]RJG46502.1 DUF3168 domain-containing protein [Mesorhizobium sp. DCY119]